MSTKSEREYERRRYEKWQERQTKARARRHRQRVVAGSIVAALVLATGVVAAFALNDDEPAATPTPEATAPASSADVPDPSLAENRTWTGSIALTQGDLGIELDGAAAPQAVDTWLENSTVGARR